jgi:predicted MPP superfamily phosphohydrolase
MLVIGVAFAFCAACILYAWFVEPLFLRVLRHEVAVEHLKKPIRILFLSDLHVGRYNSTPLLKAKIRRLLKRHKQNPFDLALIGGDLLDWEASFVPELTVAVGLLAELGIPLYAVMGNHDYFPFKDAKIMKQALASVGCVLLRNEAVEIKVDDEKLLLIGLDDLEREKGYRDEKEYVANPVYAERAARLDLYSRFDDQSPELPRVLLSHNPDAVYLPGKRPANLVVSGHTHGGQTIFHRYGGRFIPRFMPQSSFIGWSGRAVINGSTLLVSRGTQGSLFPLRFLCPADVLDITLQPDSGRR